MKNVIVKLIGGYINFLSLFSKEYAASKAIDLFAKPRKGKLTESDDEYLSKSYQEGIDFEDYEIMTYRWPGKNKTVLLAHGWESNSARWEFLIETLKTFDFNIIAVDAPAHGKSGSKQFNAILYSQFLNVVSKKFNPDIIIGHSVGGMATVFFQSEFQHEKLNKIITLGAPSEFVSVLERYSDMMGYNTKVRQGIDDFVIKKYNNPPSYYSGSSFSRKINSTGLIIHDKHDKIIPYQDALLYKEHFPDSSLITTEGFGHGLKHKDVTEHILEFIEA